MHAYEELKRKLCKELEEITEKGDINNSTLDQINKLTHSIKSIATIMAMEDAGYSEMGGSSYARGRSARTGRYVSRDGGYSGRYSGYAYAAPYSMDGEREQREQFMSQLEELMETAPDEMTRNQLRKTMSDVGNNMRT